MADLHESSVGSFESDLETYKVVPLRAYVNPADKGDTGDHWRGTPCTSGHYVVEWAVSPPPKPGALARMEAIFVAEQRRRIADKAKLNSQVGLTVVDEGQVVLPGGRLIENASVVSGQVRVDSFASRDTDLGAWQKEVTSWVTQAQGGLVGPLEDAANANRDPKAAQRHFDRLGYIMLGAPAVTPAAIPQETV